MIWAILATVAGVLVGTALSGSLLKVTASRVRWPAAQIPETAGGLISGGVVLLGLTVLFLSFGTLAGGLAAVAGAIGGVAWSVMKKPDAGTRWLRAAQGAAAGVIAVPLLLGLGLAISSLGGPFSGRPELWRDLVGDRAFPAWAATVRSGNPESRRVAMTLIRSSGRRALPVMLEGLTNQVPQVRAAAAEGLGELKPPHAYEKIAPLIGDSDAEVRKAAAGAMSKLDDPRAIVAVLEAVGKTDDLNLTQLLRNIPSSREAARECVVSGCGGNDDARYGAILALRGLPYMESEDVRAVLPALRDPSPRMRRAGLDACRELLREWTGANGAFYVSLVAMDSLSEFRKSYPAIDPNELIAAAAPLLEDKDQKLRQEAGIWIPGMCEGSSGFSNVTSPRIGDPDSRIPQLDNRRLAPIFLRLLKSPDRDAAGSAARALANLGDRRAIPVLKERDAAENSPYNCLYCIALQTLGVGPLAHSTTYPGAPGSPR